VELTDKTTRFLDQVARAVEVSGLNRTSGRMFGLLLLADRALSLDEIAETLRVSKPMISTSGRFYEHIGVLQRKQLPGDRKHYYEIRPDGFTRDANTWTQMMKAFVGLAESGLEIVGEENETARARLQEMGEFYRHLSAAVQRALGEWAARADHPETDGES